MVVACKLFANFYESDFVTMKIKQQCQLMAKAKKFPGQPVLSQLLDVIPGSIIQSANRKHQSNRYYKRLPLRVQVMSLLFGVFTYYNGLRELCEGLF